MSPGCLAERAVRSSGRRTRVVVALVSQVPLSAGEPLARVAVVRGVSASGAPVCALLVLCEHSICDGVSLGSLCNELLAHVAQYSAAPDAPVPSPAAGQRWGATLEAACAVRGWFTSRRLDARMQHLMAMPQSKGHGLLQVVDADMPQLERARLCSTYAVFGEVSAAATQQLRLRCRAHGTTVNGAVCAAFVRAASKAMRVGGVVGDASKMLLWNLVDTRRLVSPPMDASHLSYQVSGSTFVADLTKTVRGGTVCSWCAVSYRVLLLYSWGFFLVV